ncbi:MAG: MMPL family transporter [Gemmatimonadetes bacterium]|nr:MMPL family transporter [Gemmatimonadota bacterium]
MFPRTWTAAAAPWVALALAVVGLLGVWAFVDLSPEVEGDFFFAEDDPQLQASQQISERYGSGSQIVVRVADLSGDPDAYEDRIEGLTDAFLAIDGISGAYSITTDDPSSPLFSRVLLTPDSSATNIILVVDDADPEILLPRLEELIANHDGPDLDIVMSGVPVIVELIRRNLFRDLVVFSLAAALVFGVLIALIYRDVAIVVGTLTTCFVAVSVTLMITQALGVGIGLLTANLVTIVFVLTLSHVVFLTANWLRVSQAETDRVEALRQGIHATLESSFWSMTTTLLGFLSLLIATAKPLRELGIAGAIGTLTAIAVAYSVYPAFLGRWASVRERRERVAKLGSPAGSKVVVGVAAAIVVVLGVGTFRLDTDPGLLTYFAQGTELRDGLERIDADGGSSTLDIIFRDSEGGRLDSDLVFQKMQAMQAALEADSAVGVVLGPSVLLEHARTLPLARFMSLQVLLDLASNPQLGSVGLGYVSAERDEGHFFLRMRESVDEPSRDAVIDRLRSHTREAGLEPVLVGGLYDLQAQLGKLIASSLKVGIGGLLLLFLGVAMVVSRSLATTARMWLCLAGIPLVVLGTFGHFGIAVDIITSPAANVALAMGVDSMIHLVVRVRRLSGAGVEAPWAAALSQIRAPVLGATGIICAGFGIFVLSSFPPTQRFGLAVILGTVTAATMALVVLPRLVSRPAAGEAQATAA